ncbi:hypothetical protein LOD99_10784 [Oopsacas minuta]|uniref:Tc1-like transposase DDE domain-containing protein n=1 Tax=Oopsacas minuta TaxID=111878 RepID=A0AAV7KDD0_9METZ|nr:hypothetical protein LOD99_10784 [Oopsacas minuta]
MLNIAKGRRAFIYRTMKRYNETGDTNDKPRSGRPCSVRTAALKERVHQSENETSLSDDLGWCLCCWPHAIDFRTCWSENQRENLQGLDPRAVIKDLSQTMFSGQPFVFQRDDAPAHTAITTQDWLEGKPPDFIRKEEWPPYSPDLNPMDYSLWSILKNRACSVSHSTIKSLKKYLCHEWEKYLQETLRIVVESSIPDSKL